MFLSCFSRSQYQDRRKSQYSYIFCFFLLSMSGMLMLLLNILKIQLLFSQDYKTNQKTKLMTILFHLSNFNWSSYSNASKKK